MARIIPIFLFLCTFYGDSLAAVGCELNDPDRDVKRLFPESTGYRTDFITLKERGGEALQKEVEGKLGSKFDPIYESLDVPYAYYTILKDKQVIGYVHGVNQKGKYGGLQLILATDPAGKIVGFYYQRISSPESQKFKQKAFTGKFIGLSLADFYAKDSRVPKIADPSRNSSEDFKATLRGIKKNLILLDEFLLAGKHDKHYQTGGK
ncbi:MAG: hypothetical protein QME66_06860 [Candidatus Eisenbacteria bacterium]|nr:hypothetical protein [Candidatus Eisenbacteria bacterium]